MEHIDGRVLVTNIARDVLAEIAPDELPIFPSAKDAYFPNLARSLNHWYRCIAQE